MIEVAELDEVFKWLTEEKSIHLPEKKMIQVDEEIGDVLIYLLNLADKLGLDPIYRCNQEETCS